MREVENCLEILNIFSKCKPLLALPSNTKKGSIKLKLKTDFMLLCERVSPKNSYNLLWRSQHQIKFITFLAAFENYRKRKNNECKTVIE